MQKLRTIHLYLGCIFAPMLLFFAISGIWQTLGIRSSVFGWLSALHTSARFKNGQEPSSPAFRLLVIIMALSFVISVILGVIMAFKFTKSRKAAFYCLALGVLIPGVLVLIRVFGPHHSAIIP
jgi:hypothetical protein